jgi:hypothetical protein
VILSSAMSIDDSLPNDVATLQSMLVAERAARLAAQSEAQYRAVLIEKLKFTIKKLRHERFGQSAERGVLLEQLELELADLEEDAGQAEMRCQHFLLTRSSRDFGLAGPLLHSLASKGSSHLSQGCDKITCHIYCGDP